VFLERGKKMFVIPKKTTDRISDGVGKFKRVINMAQKKDLNESDTVTIITDMLGDLFGYDKYSEITSEYAIKNTFCDIAIKIGNKPKILIECKSVGTKLKENHVHQVVGYGTKEGIEWIVLTNAAEWLVYKIIFNKKPVVTEFVYGFTFAEINSRNKDNLDQLYALSREGMTRSKSALAEIFEHNAILNKYMLGQLILEDSTVSHLRKLLKKISPDLKVTPESVLELLENDVLKRDVLDPENTKDCRKVIKKKLGGSAAVTKKKTTVDTEVVNEGSGETDEMKEPVISEIADI
jgi:hypothetical protein